jgi:membrane protease YdiL (CAAX protease family)
MRALVQKLSAVQEAALITAIFAGWFIYSAFWVVLAGFPTDAIGYSNAAAVSLVVFECIMFAIAAVVLRWRGWRLQDFLFPVSWRQAPVAVGLLLLSGVINALLWEAVTSRFDDGSIFRNVTRPGVVAALLVSVVNGTFEEFFLCRYLIDRFRASGAAFAVMLSASIRMLYHVYQGPHGTVSILVFGVIVGTYYWRTRTLGAVVMTHVLLDIIALTWA